MASPDGGCSGWDVRVPESWRPEEAGKAEMKRNLSCKIRAMVPTREED